MRIAVCMVSVLLAVAAPAQSFNGRSAAEWVKDLALDDATKRDYAVWALVQMGDRAVRATARALDDERPAVRQHAAVALGRLGAVAAKAKDRLLALRADPVPAVAKAATVAAMRVQVDPAQVPQLIAALGGDDWDLQLAAGDVLASLGKDAAPAAQALVDLLQRDAVALDRTIELRLPRAPAQYWNVRESATRALGAIGPVEGVAIVAALGTTAGNREWAAREGAAKALPAFAADDKAIAFLFALLLDDEWPVRRAAAEGMAKAVGPTHPLLPKAVPQMTRALADDDGGVRRLAAEFLGACGAAAASAVPDLTQMLGSRDKNDREYATKALLRIGPAAAAAKDALIACYEAVSEDDSWRRSEVLEALAAVAPEARRELPALEAMLAEREKPVPSADVQRQQQVVEALAGLQDTAPEKRERALRQIAGLRAVEAIPHLLPLLDGDRAVRERVAAVHVLMGLDAEQIVPRLRPMLAAKQPQLRQAAARALAMFQDAESMPRVAEILAEGIDRANKDQLWQLGLTGVAELAPAMERIVGDAADTPIRRWGATQALGYLGTQQSAKVVATMVDAVAKDTTMPDPQRQQLLAIGLRVLAQLDAPANRERFTRHAEADEREVQTAAWMGLARLGDPAAKRELLKGAAPAEPEAPEALRLRLERTRLRLSQVKGCTLREVLARLRTALELPIDVSDQVPAKVLDGRFGGGYIDLLGYHPSALDVLGALSSDFFLSGGSVVPRFHGDRIELVPSEGAKAPR